MATEHAHAKVNLYLHVLGRRADGYHVLDSLAVFPGAADRLHADNADNADALTLEVTGPFGAGLAGEADNLVLRAARALAEAAGVPPRGRLVLEKHLPVASGIGGGSADAAAAVRVLSRLWGLELPPDALHRIAADLGADVPVCLMSRPARMGGAGELLAAAPVLPECGIVLANPGVAVSTPAVFRARTTAFSLPATLPSRWGNVAALAADLHRLHNDLEPPAVQLCPAIGQVLAWLKAQPGCLLARMSGSGATCFGLFADAEAAKHVAVAGPAAWWRWGGPMGITQPFTDAPRTA